MLLSNAACLHNILLRHLLLLSLLLDCCDVGRLLMDDVLLLELLLLDLLLMYLLLLKLLLLQDLLLLHLNLLLLLLLNYFLVLLLLLDHLLSLELMSVLDGCRLLGENWRLYDVLRCLHATHFRASNLLLLLLHWHNALLLVSHRLDCFAESRETAAAFYAGRRG